mgnify:CR=1 FL=1
MASPAALARTPQIARSDIPPRKTGRTFVAPSIESIVVAAPMLSLQLTNTPFACAWSRRESCMLFEEDA